MSAGCVSEHLPPCGRAHLCACSRKRGVVRLGQRSERATASARWYCEGLLWRRAVLTGRRGGSSLACERLVGVDTKGAAASTLIRLTDRALPPRVDARVAASELWHFNRSQCPSHSLGRWMCEWPYVNWREALGGSRAQDGGSGCHECLIPKTRIQFPHNSRNSLKRMPSRRFGSRSSMVWVAIAGGGSSMVRVAIVGR